MSLTAQFYAGDVDKLWTTFDAGGNHTGVPVNGSKLAVWQDEETPSTKSLIWYTTNSSNPLAYRTPGLMRLPSIEFNGTSDSFIMALNTGTPYRTLSNILANNGKTIIMAVRFNASGTNSANIYDNSALFSDSSGGYFGIHFKTVAGVHSVHAYNWDGNSDSCSVNVSLDTDYIVMVRHNGTTLNLSVLSGTGGGTRSDNSVASGNTSVMTGNPRIGINKSTARWPGYIGEVYFDNTDLGSTNSPLSDIVGRWLPAASVSLVRVRRKSPRGLTRGCK